MIRAILMLAIGIAIAFTAPLHENVTADHWMIATAFAILGLATLAEYLVQRATPGAWPIAARAVIALLAGAVLLVPQLLDFALVVTLWAILNAALIDALALTKFDSRRDTLPATILSLMLAAAVTFVRDDPVAAIGFFGAYAVIAGVFLGISAFDSRAAGAAAPTGEHGGASKIEGAG